MIRIKKGENASVTRFLQKKDKTDFNRSEFSTLSLSLIQLEKVIQTYTFPSAYLRAGVANNEIEFELSTTVSNLLSGGKVLAQYTFVIPDGDYEEGFFKLIINEDMFHVDQTP